MVEPPYDKDLSGQFWYGYADSSTNAWHYHNPQFGFATVPNATTLLGYAMDGYPIYGTVPDDSVLDECGGLRTYPGVYGGVYEYHVRTLAQVGQRQWTSQPCCDL